MFEVEVKHRLTDPEGVRAKLLALGGERLGSLDQEDRYFNSPAHDFARTDQALRIRRSGESSCITYKGPKLDAATKTRRELEASLASPRDAATASEILSAIGFEEVAAVRKTRELWRLRSARGMEIHIGIDAVASVGAFIELEMSADESGLDAARAELLALADRLQLGPGERRSYLELFLAGPGSPAAAGP